MRGLLILLIHSVTALRLKPEDEEIDSFTSCLSPSELSDEPTPIREPLRPITREPPTHLQLQHEWGDRGKRVQFDGTTFDERPVWSRRDGMIQFDIHQWRKERGIPSPPRQHVDDSWRNGNDVRRPRSNSFLPTPRSSYHSVVDEHILRLDDSGSDSSEEICMEEERVLFERTADWETARSIAGTTLLVMLVTIVVFIMELYGSSSIRMHLPYYFDQGNNDLWTAMRMWVVIKPSEKCSSGIKIFACFPCIAMLGVFVESFCKRLNGNDIPYYFILMINSLFMVAFTLVKLIPWFTPGVEAYQHAASWCTLVLTIDILFNILYFWTVFCPNCSCCCNYCCCFCWCPSSKPKLPERIQHHIINENEEVLAEERSCRETCTIYVYV